MQEPVIKSEKDKLKKEIPAKTKFIIILLVLAAVIAGVLSLYSKSADLKVGRIITFGKNQWRVLDIQNGKALILSEKVLEKRKYHENYEVITWEQCTLRKYMMCIHRELKSS